MRRRALLQIKFSPLSPRLPALLLGALWLAALEEQVPLDLYN